MKLHEIFEQLASRQPEKVAITFKEKSLTNKQLNEEANKLANYLRARLPANTNGKQPVIGVHLNRSTRPMVAMLAISKIGGIYVPLDPDTSGEHLKEICADSKIEAVILEQGLSLEHSSQTINLDTDQASIANNEAANLNLRTTVEDPIAYYCYSSGTTGKPKGIPIGHRGLFEWFKVLAKDLKSQEDRVVLGNVAINFDAHIWEYLMAWALEAPLSIADNNTRRSPTSLAEFIAANGITDATLTPSVLEYFAREKGAFEKFSSLKAVYSTGEAATEEIIKACLDRTIKFYNCYGPTEATFGITMYLIRYLSELRKGIAPIGSPNIPGIETYILNEKNEVVTDGTPGQLAFASPYMTDGYLNKEEQSQQKFTSITVPDGFGSTKTVRVHLTGDSCVKENGQLFCLGRMGHESKIKLRGQLVEPMGIEAVLNSQEFQDLGISQAQVVVKQDKENGMDPHLVAYFVVKSDPAPKWKVLRERLIQKFGLHSASIPQLQKIDAIPLTVNSKADKNALIAIKDKIYRDDSRKYNPPRTALEKELVALWAETLRMPQDDHENLIGIDDDFGALNDSSLLRMSLRDKINAKYGIEIPVADFWAKNFTIEYTAKLIFTELMANDLNADKPKFKPELLKKAAKSSTNKNAIFFLPSIIGVATEYAQLATAIDTDQAIYTFKPPGLTDPLYNCCDTDAIIEHYYQLLIKQQPEGPYYLSGWSSGAVLAFGVANKLKASGRKVRYLALIDEAAPQAPLATDPKKFAQNLLSLIEHLPAQLTKSITLAELQNKSCEEQVALVFSQLKPTTENDKNILEVVNAMIYALKLNNHAFTASPETNIQIFSATTTNSTNENNLGWSAYGKVISSSMIEGDHFSILKEPKDLGLKMSAQIKLAAARSNSGEFSDSEEKIRRDSGSSSGSSSSPSFSQQAIEQNKRIDRVNAIIYKTIEKALETPCNALTVLQLLRILIDWHLSALDKVSSFYNDDNPIPQGCKDGEVIFNTAIILILTNLEEKVFKNKTLPAWLITWMSDVRNLLDKTVMNQGSTAIQNHYSQFKKISYSRETKELNEATKTLKDDPTQQEFSSLVQESQDAINLLKKCDPMPLYQAIANKTSILATNVEEMKADAFTYTYKC
jgi:amino acid adenylation domain-containing protein